MLIGYVCMYGLYACTVCIYVYIYVCVCVVRVRVVNRSI